MTITAASGSSATENATMDAIRYDRYGSADVLELREIARPTPGPQDVLVQVVAASVNPYDLHFMRGTPHIVRLMSGLRRPKPARRTLGVDFAGTVEAIGSGVTRFAPGDEVFGLGPGALAGYVAAPEAYLAAIPAGVAHEAAAAVPVAGLTALQGLRDHGELRAGQRVLVNGAAGGVGTFAVQIARSFGAEVTGVCSTRNLDLVESMGAEHVVDYTKTDFARQGFRYDLLFDAVGNRSLSDLRRVLTPEGRLVAAAGPVWRGLWLKVGGRGRLRSYTALRDGDDLAALAELLATGEVTPVIDRRYSLSEAADAIRYLEGGHARGKVVITV